MNTLGTQWRWEFTEGLRVIEKGPWRETREEALKDGGNREGWLNCKVETAQVDAARHALTYEQRQRMLDDHNRGAR